MFFNFKKERLKQEQKCIIDTFKIECAVMKLSHYYNANEIQTILNAIRHNDQTIVTVSAIFKLENDNYKKV